MHTHVIDLFKILSEREGRSVAADISAENRPVVMVVASGGGHWTQVLRLMPAFEGCEMVYVTTMSGHADHVRGSRFYTVPDANRWTRWRAARCASRMFWLILRVRPDAVVSTGALPGFFAIYFAKKLGRRTVWIDSVANAEQLSMSGRHAGRYADAWLTQWEHLAVPDGPAFAGSVLTPGGLPEDRLS